MTPGQPAEATQPGPEANACDHHWVSHLKGGEPLYVRTCVFCRQPDWDDIRAQVADLRPAVVVPQREDEDEVERLAEELAATEWRPGYEFTAHTNHNYYGGCPICRGDLPTLAAGLLAAQRPAAPAGDEATVTRVLNEHQWDDRYGACDCGGYTDSGDAPYGGGEGHRAHQAAKVARALAARDEEADRG